MAEEVTVSIPAALRPQVDNQDTIALPGGSVGEVLGALAERYPELGEKLFKSENELNRFINVYVNDEDIRFMQKLDTPVSGQDEIALVPAIAGG